MSELKTYKMVDEKYCTDCVCVIPSEVYLKSEADYEINKLQNKVADLLLRDKNMALNFNNVFNALARYKYKHCLNMAYKCLVLCQKSKDLYRWAEDENLEHHYNHKIEFFARWHKRWLELAEKFKEAK